jgi:hypothetical protein
LLSRKFFFWFNVNQNLLDLRHVFQTSVLLLMSYAMPFPYGQGATNGYAQVCITSSPQAGAKWTRYFRTLDRRPALRNKFVASTVHGNQKTWRGGIRLELLSQA